MGRPVGIFALAAVAESVGAESVIAESIMTVLVICSLTSSSPKKPRPRTFVKNVRAFVESLGANPRWLIPMIRNERVLLSFDPATESTIRLQECLQNQGLS